MLGSATGAGVERLDGESSGEGEGKALHVVGRAPQHLQGVEGGLHESAREDREQLQTPGE